MAVADLSSRHTEAAANDGGVDGKASSFSGTGAWLKFGLGFTQGVSRAVDLLGVDRLPGLQRITPIPKLCIQEATARV